MQSEVFFIWSGQSVTKAAAYIINLILKMEDLKDDKHYSITNFI